MPKKRSSLDVVMGYLDRIKTDWELMTYDEIRKQIYRDCGAEIGSNFIACTCKRLGVDRSKIKELNRHKKYKNWIY